MITLLVKPVLKEIIDHCHVFFSLLLSLLRLCFGIPRIPVRTERRYLLGYEYYVEMDKYDKFMINMKRTRLMRILV